VTVTGPQFDAASYIASDFAVDGNQGRKVYTVEAHRGSEIQVSIQAPSANFAKWNTQVICPGLKIFGGQYGRREVVCPGAERIYFPSAELTDRQGALRDKRYKGFTHGAVQQGFGLIYVYLNRTMWISDSAGHMFCKEE
jgi:hypothetical protein